MITTWEDEDLNLKDKLLRGIFAYGFENPSPIQKSAVPTMIAEGKDGERRDIIAQAQSGTGKTGAFTISTLQIIDESVKQTQALIIATSFNSIMNINLLNNIIIITNIILN